MTLDLRTERLDLPFVHEFTIARSSEAFGKSVVARVRWNGIEGLGEAAPSARYGENVDSVIAALAAHPLGDSPYRIDALLAGLPPAARCALDIALYDLIGKDLDRPLWQLFGLDPAGTPRTSSGWPISWMPSA